MDKLRFYCWVHGCGLIPMMGKKGMYYRCRYWDYRYRPVGTRACTFTLSLLEIEELTKWVEGNDVKPGMEYIYEESNYNVYAAVTKIAGDLVAVKVKKVRR